MTRLSPARYLCRIRWAAAPLAVVMLALGVVAQPPAVNPAAPPQVGIPPNELQLTMSAAEIKGERYDWGVIALKADAAHAKGITGKGVVVVVLDTGVEVTHVDLKPVDSFIDYTGFGTADKQGHGTHCSGSIASRLNDDGFIGVAPGCTLRHVKVLGDNGSGGVDKIAAGCRKAVEEGGEVLSFSLGGGGPESWIPPAFKAAEEAGAIVVVASGNESQNEVSYPGRYPNCIAVGAVDANLRRASFSNGGPELFVCGPGVNIRSTYPGGQYATMSGTSMATPHIAGVAALWIQCNPSVPKKERPAKFRKWLASNCRDLGQPGRDISYGHGFPDCSKLELAGGTPVDPPTNPGEPAKAVLLTTEDLTPAARVKLGLAGYADFGLALTPTRPAFGHPKQMPSKIVPETPDEPQNIGPAVAPLGTPSDLRSKWRNLPGIGWGWVDPSYDPTAPTAVTATVGVTTAPVILSPGCAGGRCPTR